MDDDSLWTPKELAKFLGYCESTICRMVSQTPDKLPPRVSSLGRPRWVPAVAREWARDRSDLPIGRIGRPRKLR
jgi:hypothetical protein